MNFIARFTTPKKIRTASDEVFKALLIKPQGQRCALDIPNGDQEMAEVVAYLLRTKGDYLRVSMTNSGMVLELAENFAMHSPEGRRALMQGGRMLQTLDPRAIMAAAARMKAERE